MRIKKKGEYTKLINGEEDNTLIIASSGHGKGLAGERIAQEFYKKGWCVITLPEAKQNMEFGFATFKPERNYHLNALKFQQETPEAMPVINYHPYTKNFPKHKLPPYNIYTIDIKSLDRLMCYFLFEETTETASLGVLMNSLNVLKNSEGLKELLEKIKVNKIIERKISLSLEKFNYDPLIFPNNFPYNLDMEKIIKDNQNYHVFSSRYVNDAKVRDFITLYLLQEIIKVKQQNPNTPPVCIFMDEIKSLCPEHPVYNFKITLSKIVSEILSTCRGLGINIISTTQIYNEVNASVRGAFNNLLLGKMSDLKDFNEIAQIIKIDYYSRKEIFGLKNNQFYLLNTGDGVDEGSFLIFLPQHCHCERGFNFDTMFARYFPEKLRNHTEELNKIGDWWKNSLK